MMREITRFNVEQFKKERRSSFNGRGTNRAPASVDRELQLLSRDFSLAIEHSEVQINPCKSIKLLAVSNEVTGYLSPEQEEKRMAVLTRRRAHLRDILIINLHTGMRRTEILTLHKGQIDFLRGSIELTKTKSGKSRSVPIHSAIKPLLQRLCDQAG
jgi:integrase